MNKDDNLKSWKEGQSGNPNGRPKGARNRSTIAREMLEAVLNLPDGKMKQTLELLGLKTKGEAEELLTAVQIAKALKTGDTRAYQALMDSSYGAPKNQVETTGDTVIRVVHEEKPKPEE